MQEKNKEVRVTAKTLEKAMREAAILLQVDQTELDYRVISQTNGGFLSFIGKKIEIAAWAKMEKRSHPQKPPRRRGATKNQNEGYRSELRGEMLSQEEVDALVADLTDFCAGICSYLTDGRVEVTSELSQGRLLLDIDDDFLASQVTKNSKLAESIEHILRKKPRHLKRELPFRIFVDVRGIRREREEGLAELARDLSEKVNENKRPIVLNYKSSYDRKIIHMALDKDERVYTKSIGSGPNRKLMILPIKEKEDHAN